MISLGALYSRFFKDRLAFSNGMSFVAASLGQLLSLWIIPTLYKKYGIFVICKFYCISMCISLCLIVLVFFLSKLFEKANPELKIIFKKP